MMQDPLATCNPQYREEAEKIVARLRMYLGVIQTSQPSVAVVAEKKINDLLEKFRKNNQCPHLSTTNGSYQDELKSLNDYLKEQALAAREVAVRKQAIMVESQKGEEQAMIIAAVSVVMVLLAIGATVYLLKRNKV